MAMRDVLRKCRNSLSRAKLRWQMTPDKSRILDSYVKTAPSAQNALDIFSGEWVSQLPEPFSGLKAGGITLFADNSIARFLTEIGGVAGKTVLELGPLEGGHSYMFSQSGAKEIVAIEANSRAFMKCLVVKDLLKLQRVHFRCGDFVEYLRQDGPQFEIGVASGVLYHMQNPAEVIALLAARCTEHVYVWTHYYDEETIAGNRALAVKFSSSKEAEHAGFRHTLYRQEYLTSLGNSTFCGGSAPHSQWMTRGDILKCLEFFGFRNPRISFEDAKHPHGPAFAVVSSRKQ